MFALRILLINTFVGKIRRGRLVNWVEKGGFKKIQKLLEIFERERYHEILLTVKNCDALNSEGPLTTSQPVEYSWMSSNPTTLTKIGQSLLCTGSSTQGTKPVPTIYNDHTRSTCE